MARFHIQRTTHWNSEVEAPCEEAFRASYVYTDFRTTDDPSKIPMNKGDTSWWYLKGRNHRVVNGQIARDFDREDWFVEVDDILAFAKKYGDLVIKPEEYGSTIPSIEIYDGYRE